MGEVQVRQAREMGGQLGRLFGGDVEAVDLDGNLDVPIGIAREKDRAQNAGPDLMQDNKASEPVRSRIRRRRLSGQRWYSFVVRRLTSQDANIERFVIQRPRAVA
jgi:hypothetical protein